MDVGKIHGSGNIGRGHEKPARTEIPRDSVESRGLQSDVAHISDSGRETRDSVEALADKLREEPADRRQLVADAKARLESGALDTPDVHREVARRLLTN